MNWHPGTMVQLNELGLNEVNLVHGTRLTGHIMVIAITYAHRGWDVILLTQNRLEKLSSCTGWTFDCFDVIPTGIG